MIKHLTAITLLILTPRQIAYNVNEFSYLKTNNEVYIESGNSNQEYGSYNFVNVDSNQILNNSVEYKTTVIEQMEIDNDRHQIWVKAISYTQINNNGVNFDLSIDITNSYTNTNDVNLVRYIRGNMTLNNISWEDELNYVNNEIEHRYTDPYYTRDQITNIYNKCMSTGNFDDDYTDLQKANYPNDFYEKVNNNLGNRSYNYTEDSSNTIELGIIDYIEMRFNYTGRYQDLPTETKQSYFDTFKGLSKQVNILAKTEQIPISVSGDIVDIPGLIFTILGMPFSWISTAFNLTLFPGTPYSVNISTILLGVIGLLIAIFIIRKLIK